MLSNNKELMELETKLAIASKKSSDYAMALDLMGKVTRAETEKEAVEDILQVFQILFAPSKLFYLSFKENLPDQLHYLQILTEDEAEIKNRLSNLGKKYAWTESGKGFQIKINYRGRSLGIVEIDEIGFPEYKEHYLNLTESIIEVFGLAIENARRYQKIKDAENKLRKEKENLERAMAQIKTLSGLLPICMHCKNIRDDKGYWKQMEEFIQDHSDAQFSHSICQSCAKKYYPDYDIYDD
ncbi:MAG: hypothetical protein HQK65_18775 [Desulfamplus sp.]|nr:hypothetical protein [Desulfamplus sp.]